MADISKITLPSGTTYNIKDAKARELISSLSGALTYLGTTTTVITDGSAASPITIGDKSVTPKAGNVVDTIAGWDYCPDGKVYSIQISTNGDYIVHTSFLTYSGNSRYLVGFGASDHQINVQAN